MAFSAAAEVGKCRGLDRKAPVLEGDLKYCLAGALTSTDTQVRRAAFQGQACPGPSEAGARVGLRDPLDDWSPAWRPRPQVMGGESRRGRGMLRAGVRYQLPWPQEEPGALTVSSQRVIPGRAPEGARPLRPRCPRAWLSPLSGAAAGPAQFLQHQSTPHRHGHCSASQSPQPHDSGPGGSAPRSPHGSREPVFTRLPLLPPAAGTLPARSVEHLPPRRGFRLRNAATSWGCQSSYQPRITSASPPSTEQPVRRPSSL